MRHSLHRLLSSPTAIRLAARTRSILLIPVIAATAALATPQAEGTTIPLTSVRSSDVFSGGAVDPTTGKFYQRTTYDGNAQLRVYNDVAAFEAGTQSALLGFNPKGYNTYFGVQGGKVFTRSTSGGSLGEPSTRYTEMVRWNAATGVGEQTLGSVPDMGGRNNTHTFNWGGYSGVNVLNDNGQLYVLGQRLDSTGFLLVKLNADLTIASSQTLEIPLVQGFAFAARGKLFIGSSYNLPTIQRMVDLTTGEVTPVTHAFAGPASWYITNAFYDAATDRLYVYNRGTGLHRAENVAALLNLVDAAVAIAGPDQTVDEGAVVTLTGTDSYDGNTPSYPLSYSWTQLSGVPVTLDDASSATPSFTAPEVPPAGAVLVFQLTVSNGYAEPATDTVTINVGNLNFPPVANAGAAQIVAEGVEVTLQGTGTDADGDALSLSWTQKSGPLVELHDADSAEPWFMAPAVSFETGAVELVFTLVVNDGLVNSGPSDVTVHVVNVNAPPVAHAGVNQSVNELASVTLDGTQSSDPDGNALTYAWTQIAGQPTVTLLGGSTATPSFIAPSLDFGGRPEGTTLTFRLTVGDGELTSESTVNVRVSNVNHQPIADAGANKTVPENTLVTLDGSGSADTDGDELTYLWEQIDTGFPVVLDDATAQSPAFMTPDVGSDGAVLQFKLTVDDGYGGVASSEVTITVTYANRAPVADAGLDGSVEEGSTVLVTGAGTDADANDLEFRWEQVSGPSVTLTNAFSAATSFTAPQVTRAGDTVVLRLTVSDPYGGEDSDEVSIALTNRNRAPLATAPANLNVTEGSTVELIGQGMDPDTEEQAELVYQWQQIAPTAGTAVAGHAHAFVAPMLEGTQTSLSLTYRLTVTDPNGASATDDVTIVVARVAMAPTAVASGAQFVNEASTVTLNGSASSAPANVVLNYAWVQTFGPAVTLSEADTAYPYFTAPLVSADGAVLKFLLTVDDGIGGSSSDEVTINVVNINDAPIVEIARPSVPNLWPPDHRLVKVCILDVLDTNATVKITSVTQNEAPSGTEDGDVPVDVIISEDAKSVLLRAERSAHGTGRIYCIHFVAEDFEHSVSGTVKVIVPKNKKGEPIQEPVVVQTTSTSSTLSIESTPTLAATDKPGKSDKAGKPGKSGK